MTAERSISWLENLEEAKEVSAKSGKPMLIFFHSVHCAGCLNTFNKTLTKMSVIDFVNEGYIPALFEVSQKEDLAKTYNVEWTPTFIVADETGLEADRWEGYLPEDDYLGHLNIGLAIMALKKGDYKEAERRFDEVLIKFPLSDLAPQACYFQGVAKFRGSNDPSWLIKAYGNLKDKYPESTWTLKASVFTEENFRAVEESLKKAA